MNTILKFILYPLILFLSYLVYGLIFWGNHTYMLTCTLISAFIILNIFYKKNGFSLVNSILIILPIEILFFITLFFSNALYSIIVLYIVLLPLSIFAAYLFYRYKNFFIIIVFAFFSYFSGFYILPNVHAYFTIQNTDKNIKFPDIQFNDRTGNEIALNKKIIVLDFWYSKCSVCFEKFPEFEDLYTKYHKNSDVKIYSVNVPMKNEKKSQITKIVDSLNYKFPVIYSNSMKEIKDSLGFNTFPHMIIIKNGNIRYDGFPQTNKKVIVKSVYDKIDELLNEK